MQFCPGCGKSTEPGDLFCKFCGTPLKDHVVLPSRSSSSTPVFYPEEPPLQPSDLPVRSLEWPKAETALSPVKVLGIICIILLLAVAASFLLFGSPQLAGTPGNESIPQGSAILPGSGQCPEGMSLCSGTCVNLQTDPGNCGACGFSVPYQETCIQGKFSGSVGANNSEPFPASTATPSPVPTNTSITGSASTSATASVPQGSCRTGQKLCSGTCTDLQKDSRNCGSCGYICPSGLTCQNSWCLEPGSKGAGMSTGAPVPVSAVLSCEHGDTLCGSSCVNIFTDKKNCGVCGRACGSQEICLNARCGPACTESGTTLCGDSCVDLDTDINNCGSCGLECETFLPNAKGSLCTNGQCIVSQCKTDYDDCNGILSDGCEIYLRLDAGNCGSCGTKCPTGQVCYDRQCRVPVVT